MSDYFQQGSYSSNIVREFIRNVYTYMFGALGISGVIAYLVGSNQETFFSLFVTATGSISPLFWVVTFSPMLIVFAMSLGFERFSMPAMLGLFIAYSVLMGLSLSSIFIAYSIGTIALAFVSAAFSFGLMAFLGYTTKTDLTKFGSLLYMALFGVIVAMLINFFMKSEAMDYMISVICVFIFTGLAAYKMQMLKELAHNSEMSPEQRSKMELFGGLTLYITFVNLFLTLLRLFGNRD